MGLVPKLNRHPPPKQKLRSFLRPDGQNDCGLRLAERDVLECDVQCAGTPIDVDAAVKGAVGCLEVKARIVVIVIADRGVDFNIREITLRFVSKAKRERIAGTEFLRGRFHMNKPDGIVAAAVFLDFRNVLLDKQSAVFVNAVMGGLEVFRLSMVEQQDMVGKR